MDTRRTTVRLAAVADIREDRGPNFISRENVQRKIVVMANVAEGKNVSQLFEGQAQAPGGAGFPDAALVRHFLDPEPGKVWIFFQFQQGLQHMLFINIAEL